MLQWTIKTVKKQPMFFKIDSLKSFAIFTGKHLCWGLFLIKLQTFRPATFLKRDSNTGVSCAYCEIFKNSFFIEILWWLLLKALLQYSKVSCGVCSLISHLHVLSILIKNTAWKVFKYWVFSDPYSVRVRENTDQKKLCIWTLFTDCFFIWLSSEQNHYPRKLKFMILDVN